MTRALLVPNPWRALVAVLLAGLAGSFAGLLSGETGEPMFPPPVASDPRLRDSPHAALLKLEDVLPLSPELEVQPAGYAAPEAPPEEEGPDYEGWGRTEVHRVGFWRPNASADADAPIEVHSEASLYRDTSGAQRSFTYWTGRLAAEGTPVPLALPVDQAAAFTVEAGPFTHQWVQFRKANGVGFLLVTGIAGHTGPETAGELARTMAERMR